jgi:hypothetical protein
MKQHAIVFRVGVHPLRTRNEELENARGGVPLQRWYLGEVELRQQYHRSDEYIVRVRGTHGQEGGAQKLALG